MRKFPLIMLLLIIIMSLGIGSAATSVTNYASSATYGYAMRGVAVDDNYVYYCGETDLKIYQVYKNNMTLFNSSPSFSYTIYDIEAEDNSLYLVSRYYVYKYYANNYTRAWTSPSYGGTLRAIDIQGDYIYATGNGGVIKKLYKSTGTEAASSAAISGETLHTLDTDSEYIYTSGALGILRKYDIATMTQQTSNTIGGGIVYAVSESGDYVYAGTATTCTIGKYYKSNLTNVDTSASFGGSIYAMDTSPDGSQIAVGGGTVTSMKIYGTSDMDLDVTSATATICYNINWDDQTIYTGGGSTSATCKAYTTYTYDTASVSDTHTSSTEFSRSIQMSNMDYTSTDLRLTGTYGHYIGDTLDVPYGASVTSSYTIPTSGNMYLGGFDMGFIDPEKSKWIASSDGREYSNSIYNASRYTFDEYSGTTVYNWWEDGTDSFRDLTITNAVLNGDFGGGANSNGYLPFDGVDDYAAGNLPTVFNYKQKDNTLSCMVYIRNTGTTQTIMSLHSTTDADTVMEVQLLADQSFQIFARDETSAGYTSTNVGTTYAVGWHHLVLTNNNGALTLYVDKVSKATLNLASGGTFAYDRVMVGGVWWASQCVSDSNQIVDELHVYDDILSTAEIASEYTFDFAQVADDAPTIGGGMVLYPSSGRAIPVISGYKHSSAGSYPYFSSYSASKTNNDPLYSDASPARGAITSSTPTLSLTVLEIQNNEEVKAEWYVDNTLVGTTYTRGGLITNSLTDNVATGDHTWYANLTDEWGGKVTTETFTFTVPTQNVYAYDTNTADADFNAGTISTHFYVSGNAINLNSGGTFGGYISQNYTIAPDSVISAYISKLYATTSMGVTQFIDGQWQWVASTDNRENGGLMRFPFDEKTTDATGVFYDVWNDGTDAFTQGAYYNTAFVGSISPWGDALYSDGETDYATIGYNYADGNSFTQSCWVNYDGSSDGDSYFLFGEPSEYWMELYPTGALVFWARNVDGGYNGIGMDSTLISDSNWHLITVTYNNNVVNLYVDGVWIKSYVIDIVVDSNTMRISSPNDTGTSSSFKGYYDEFRIYETALPPEQILAIYQDTNPYVAGSTPFTLDVLNDEYAKSRICISMTEHTSGNNYIYSDTLSIYNTAPYTVDADPDQVTTSSSTNMVVDVVDPEVAYDTYIASTATLDGSAKSLVSRSTNGEISTATGTMTGGIHSWTTALTDSWGGLYTTSAYVFDSPLTITNTTGNNYIRFAWDAPSDATDYFLVYINGTLRYNGTNNYYNNTQYFYGPTNACQVTVTPVNSTYTGQNTSQVATLVNVAPILTPIDDTFHVYVGSYFTLSPSATDANNDTLTYSDTCSLFNVNSTTGYVNYLAQDADIGTYNFNVTVSDGLYTDTETITLQITKLDITSIDINPALNITRFAPYTITAGVSNATSITSAYSIVNILNGEGGYYGDYYVNGTAVTNTKNVSMTYNAGTLTSSDLYPDTLYPEIYYAPSSYTWYHAPSDISVYRHNYHIMNVQNPFTSDSNMSFFVEINAAPVSGTTSVPLQVYLVSKDAPLSYFESNWLSGSYTTLLGTIPRTASYHHTHTANATHYLIPVSTDASGHIGGLDINDEFYIVLYANTNVQGNGWNLRYHTFPSSASWYTADRISTNSWGTPVAQTNSPAVHVHIARNDVINDGVLANVFVTSDGLTVNETDTYYFTEIPNLAPTASLFTNPTNGTYQGIIPITWEPSLDANNDAITYDIALLHQNGTLKQYLVNDTSSTSYNFASTTVSDGNYDLRAYATDAEGLTTTWTLGEVYDYFTIQNIYRPPTPVNLQHTSGNFHVDWTWDAGTGNVTDSYNVSLNGVWTNSTTDSISDTGMSPHETSNISVYSFNDSGLMSIDALSGSYQLPNNPISIAGIDTDYLISEGSELSVDCSSVDADSDTPTFSCNRTDLFSDFSTTTGIGSWTPGYDDSGVYYVNFGVSDGYGSTDNETVTITVSNIQFTPNKPTFNTATTGNFWVYHSWFNNDPDHDTYNVSLGSGSWINGTTTANYNRTSMSPHGTSAIKVYSYNTTSGALSLGETQSVTIPNNPVSVSVLTTADVEELTQITADASATDLDSDTITYSCNRTTLFTDFNTSTGIGHWTPGIFDSGTYYVSFTANDGHGSTDTEVVTYTISDKLYDMESPENLTQTHGNFYVHWTWEPGVGDITDSYNVSLNGVWINGTTNTYANDDDMDPHAESEIIIYAYNVSGSLSGPITDSYTLGNNVPSITDFNITNEPCSTPEVTFDTIDLDSDVLTHSVSHPALFTVDNNHAASPTWTFIGDEGTYTVTFTTEDAFGGSDNESVTFTYNAYDPEVLSQWNSVTLDADTDIFINSGDDVTLRATAQDYLTTEWSVDGAPVVDSDLELTLNDITAPVTEVSLNLTGCGVTEYANWTITLGGESNVPVILTKNNNVTNDSSSAFNVVYGTPIYFSVTTIFEDNYEWKVNGAEQFHDSSSFTWTPTSSDVGANTVQVIVTNEAGSANFTWTPTVTTPLTLPTFTSWNNNVTNDDELTFITTNNRTILFMVSASDVDEYDWIVNNVSRGLDITSFTFDTLNLSSPITVSAAATNENGTAYKTWTLVIDVPGDQAPIFDDIDTEQSVYEGAILRFYVNAVDPEGQDLTYNLFSAPDGVNFEDQWFEWSPTYLQAGDYNLRFMVTDGNNTVYQYIDIEVIDVPRSTSSGSTSGGSGGGISGGSSASTTSGFNGDTEPTGNVAYKENYVIYTTTTGKESVAQFKHPEGHGIVGLSYVAENTARNIGITVEKLDGPSLFITNDAEPDLTHIYQYVNVWVGSEGYTNSISDGELTFRVSNSWLKNNEVNEVIVMGYKNGEWVTVPVESVGTSSTHEVFKAHTSDFGILVIGGRTTPIIDNVDTETGFIPNAAEEFANLMGGVGSGMPGKIAVYLIVVVSLILLSSVLYRLYIYDINQFVVALLILTVAAYIILAATGSDVPGADRIQEITNDIVGRFK